MLSVIITAYREERTIGRCLKSVLKQIPKDAEVIVTCPDEGTIEAAKKVKDGRIKIVRDEGRGKPAALNLAVEKANGDILFLTDGDVYLRDGTIKNTLRHFENSEVGAVSGRPVYICSKKSLFYEWAALCSRALVKKWERENERDEFFHISGYVYGIRKDVFPKLPENILVDDAFIGYKVREKGYRVVFEENAVAYVKFPENVIDFLKQKVRTRAGFVQMKALGLKMPRSPFSEIIVGFKEGLKIYGYKKLPKLLLVCLIYLVAWFMGVIKGRKVSDLKKIWKRVESTK